MSEKERADIIRKYDLHTHNGQILFKASLHVECENPVLARFNPALSDLIKCAAAMMWLMERDIEVIEKHCRDCVADE